MANTLTTPVIELVNERVVELEAVQASQFKIDDLLCNLGFLNFDVANIQHSSQYQNCVYALTSRTDPTEKYILRTPGMPEPDDAGICPEIENDVAILGYLRDKLPVPIIKAYSSASDNILEKPYTIQTRLPGVSLDNVYEDLTHEEKLNIVDQFVPLMAKIESIRFDTAGTFSATPSQSRDNETTAIPPITFFDEGDEEFMQGPSIAQDRSGTNLKSFLQSHVDGWIQTELKRDKTFTLSGFKFCTTILKDLDQEGAFKSTPPPPIVLNHWDLEARNIMVENIDGAWKIHGIIDWDGALALPRPLARRAPDWIWDFDSEGFTGYLDNDHHPKPDSELSAENAALKAYFDAKAAELLEGYLEDAYGHGMWLRRIWTFAKGGANTMFFIELIKQLEDDWKARPVPKSLPSSSPLPSPSPSLNSEGLLTGMVECFSGFLASLRRWL